MTAHEDSDNPPMTPPSRPRNEAVCAWDGRVVQPGDELRAQLHLEAMRLAAPGIERETAKMRGLMLSFPGDVPEVTGAGPVDTSAFPAAHPGDTPTTITRDFTRDERVAAFLRMGQIGLSDALDAGSAMGRKLAMQSAKTCIEQALELLK